MKKNYTPVVLMFGVNKIIGKTFFKKAAPNELLVTSRFFTLQGEGPYRGHPAYFIRLAHCNLACSFCDTYFDSGDWRSFSSLLEEADEVIAEFFKDRALSIPAWAQGLSKKIVLVITGGEPSLQNNLSAFLQEAQNYFYCTQIESNGTALLPNLPQTTTLVVSPKCLEKDGKALRYLKINPKILERADCLKFIISAPGNGQYTAYSQIPSWAQEWTQQTKKPVFISPMNCYKKAPQPGSNLGIKERSELNERVSFWEPDILDLSKNQQNHEYAAEYCLKFGYILNLQIHLFANLP